MSEQRTQSAELVKIHRREFAVAEKLDGKVTWLQAGAGLLGVVGLALPEGAFGDVLAVVALGIAISTFAVGYQCRKRRLVAEDARRATLLVDGLGMVLSGTEMRRFAVSSDASPEELAKWGDPGWFASGEAPGVARAAEILEESAFWSAHLFDASAREADKVLGIGSAATLACFVLALRLFSTETNDMQVRFFGTVAASLVSVEFLMRSVHYRLAARRTGDILSRLGHLRKAGYPHDDFLLALVDYNSAVESAPMMAPGVYRKNQDRLNELWKAYR